MCGDSNASHQSDDCADVFSFLFRLDTAVAFLRVIALAFHGDQSSKNRCRTNSQSTRMMVGRYICHFN